MLDFNAIGDKIHDLRAANGYSQDKLAEILGVTHQAISRWECGLAAPTVDNIAELCALFDVDFETLLCIGKPVNIDADDIFAGHSRLYVVKQIAEGRVDYDIATNFAIFMPQERLMLLKAIKAGKVSVNTALLQRKLTDEEKLYLRGRK